MQSFMVSLYIFVNSEEILFVRAAVLQKIFVKGGNRISIIGNVKINISFAAL